MVARFPLTTTEHPVFTRNRTLVANRAASRKPIEARSSFSSPDGVILNILAPPTASGARVNEWSASSIPVFAACVALLADMVAKLPLTLYRTSPDGATAVTDHPSHRLVSVSPSELSTPCELRQLTQSGYGFGGNGYQRVWRDSYYQPGELQWLPPCDVRPEVLKYADGRRRAVYWVSGENQPLSRADVVHVRGPSINGITGMSPVYQLRESIGLSLTQREQAGKIAANGARFPGILSTPASLNADQLKDARVEWQKNQGGTENAGKTAILHGAWSYAATNGMTMADAEFLESRKFERTEICTLFRIPEVLLGNGAATSSWGTGIETLTNGFLTLTLEPILVNWEQALGYTLLTADEQANGFYFKFNRRALLAVLLDSQAKFLRDMRDIGVMSINDCRHWIDENKLPAEIGDNYSQPFNGSGGTAAKPALPAPTS